MIVNTSRKKSAELDQVIEDLKRYYHDALEQNCLTPGFIHNPLAWALYQTWQKYNGR